MFPIKQRTFEHRGAPAKHTVEPSMDALVEMIARVLATVVESPEHITYSCRAGTWHLLKYARHVVRVSKASPAAVLAAGIYIGRFIEAWPQARFQASGPHRVFLTSLMLACKTLEDQTYSNATWAKVGMLFSVNEVNICERELLSFLSYRLHISAEEYAATLAAIEPSLGPITDGLAEESPCAVFMAEPTPMICTATMAGA